MHTSRRIFKVGPALALVALALPASAMAQATRTWVSGVGDDANPCSRTAPCKTFAGAYSKTAAGGEINVIDPGGFGAVTIGKSLTIKAEGITAGVLVSGTNAIVVNAGANDKVTLKGLDINGIHANASPSLVGVKVLSAKTVHLVNDEIYSFLAGLSVQTVAANTSVVMINSHVHDNGVGVLNAPGNGTVVSSIVNLRNDLIADNTCNVATSSFGPNASTPDANTNCGSQSSASGFNARAVTNVLHSEISDASNVSLFARGSQAIARLGDSDNVQNSVNLLTLDGASIRSFGDNLDAGNATTNAPTTVIPHSKRVAKRGSKRTF
jgi:hypothetical protein